MTMDLEELYNNLYDENAGLTDKAGTANKKRGGGILEIYFTKKNLIILATEQLYARVYESLKQMEQF